jgi:TonB family protein
MTRSIFAAALALTPALLHAQASSPAQTSSVPVLSASAYPAVALKSGDPKVVNNGKERISTGIVGPHLLQPINLNALAGAHPRVLANDVTVVVSLIVDASGKPGELAISQSGRAALDEEVLNALREARFQAGTLDGQPFALPVNLKVLVQRGSQY